MKRSEINANSLLYSMLSLPRKRLPPPRLLAELGMPPRLGLHIYDEHAIPPGWERSSRSTRIDSAAKGAGNTFGKENRNQASKSTSTLGNQIRLPEKMKNQSQKISHGQLQDQPQNAIYSPRSDQWALFPICLLHASSHFC